MISTIIKHIKSFFNSFGLANIDKSVLVLYNDNEKIQLQQLIDTRTNLQSRIDEIDAEIDEIVANAKRLYR